MKPIKTPSLLWFLVTFLTAVGTARADYLPEIDTSSPPSLETNTEKWALIGPQTAALAAGTEPLATWNITNTIGNTTDSALHGTPITTTQAEPHTTEPALAAEDPPAAHESTFSKVQHTIAAEVSHAAQMVQNSTRKIITGWQQQGIASWYGPGFHGRLTANGERFNTQELTAAHRTLPFGTRVLVRHMPSGREVVVRINDRGPFIKGRIIDLSQAAARALGIAGIGSVSLERVKE